MVFGYQVGIVVAEGSQSLLLPTHQLLGTGNGPHASHLRPCLSANWSTSYDATHAAFGGLWTAPASLVPVVILVAPSAVVVLWPIALSLSSPIVLIEPPSSEVVLVGIFVVQFVPRVAGVPSNIARGGWLGEGKPGFEQLVALNNDVDLNEGGSTRLLEGCQFLTELSF